jgi:zinc transporter ZupT
VYGVVAAAAILAGALACARGVKPGNGGQLAALRAIGAGFLIGVVGIDAAPAGFRAWGDRWMVATLLLVVGYAALHGVERLFVHGHQHHPHCETGHGSALSEAAAWTGVIGLALHTLLDGAAVASTAVTGTSSGVLMALGLVAHQAPVGASAAALALSASGSATRARAAGLVVALAAMVGAVAFVMASRIAPYALPLMAGITLHVVIHDLLPTLGSQGVGRATLLVVAGTLVYLATEALLRAS